MSYAFVSELPKMLFDEQHADACNVKYHLPEDVFDLDKWHALVRAACATDDLRTTDGGMANIVEVNAWLATGGLGLWSAFQLHNPLLPDMGGMFEDDYASLPAPIKERISLIFHFSPWNSLSPKERWDKVFEIDALNTPKSRLRSALCDVVFWGERIGPFQTLSAAAKRKLQEWENLPANQPSEEDLKDKRIGEMEQWVNRIESLKDLMLIGRVAETDIGEFVKLLQEAFGQPWCRNVRFPVWLNKFNRIHTTSADSQNDITTEQAAEPQSAPEIASAAKSDSRSTFPRVVINDTKKRRFHLDDPIDAAIAVHGYKVQSIWAQLIDWATSKDKPYVELIGITEDGIQYKGKKFQADCALDILTRKQLSARISRRKAAHSKAR